MNRMLKALVGGIIFFCLVFTMGFALTYLTFLLRGMEFLPSIAARVAAKGGAVAGVAMAIVFFIGEPRPRKPH